MQESSAEIHPWLEASWRQIFAVGARLHHALLITGPAGIGKLAMAEALAARLLCEAPGLAADAPACGSCQSCRWLAGGNHPDFRRVVPDQDEEGSGEEAPAKASIKKKASGVIKIDQVRALEDFVYVGSHRRGNRVVLLSPAEAMNPAAANALLKILEEPPASVYFVMTSTQWRRLLPTIRSRCRVVALGRPTEDAAKAWLEAQGVAEAERLLQVAGGAPLTARLWSEQGRLAGYEATLSVLAKPEEGVLSMASRWDGQLRTTADATLEGLVDTVQKWMADLIQVKVGARPRFHRDRQAVLAKLAGPALIGRLLNCYNELIDIRAVAGHPLNTQLFLEDLAARYLRALRPEKA